MPKFVFQPRLVSAGLRMTTKNLSQDSRYLGRGRNTDPLGYKPEALSLDTACSVKQSEIHSFPHESKNFKFCDLSVRNNRYECNIRFLVQTRFLTFHIGPLAKKGKK